MNMYCSRLFRAYGVLMSLRMGQCQQSVPDEPEPPLWELTDMERRHRRSLQLS
jgi:hypothetical protein